MDVYAAGRKYKLESECSLSHIHTAKQSTCTKVLITIDQIKGAMVVVDIDESSTLLVRLLIAAELVRA